MPAPRLTVVLSQGQSQNPAKRGLEEEIAAALIMEPGIDVSIVPHLYDLNDEHTGMLFLRSVQGDMVVLSWMFARAAHWELDRVGVKGQVGTVLLKKEDESEDEFDEEMLAEGILDHVPPPITDLTPFQNRKLVQVQGKPLSETIVEERR